jgi:hypothetical protein
MLKDVIQTTPLAGHCLHLRFEDGTEGSVDLGPRLSFRGVFAPLKDLTYFRQVRVDSDLGTITWPNGADLDPDVLYSLVTSTSIEIESARQ